MATEKTGPDPQKGKANDPKLNFFRVCSGLMVLLLLIVGAGFLVRHMMVRRQPLKIPARQAVRVSPKPDVPQTKIFEIYPSSEIIVRRTTGPQRTLTGQKPRVAIIIDDLGYDRILADNFLDLHHAFSYSVLPFSPFQNRIVQKLHAKKSDLLLHLPMEPLEYPRVDPGPGALLTSMSPDQLMGQLEKNLDAGPYIQGVNNHMGSKMTTDAVKMGQIFSVLKKRGFFFIDSLTTAKSVGKSSAGLFKIPFAQRDVFLDHIVEAEFIRKQLAVLIRLAMDHGEALGIAHPHALSYDILRESLPDLLEQVDLVPVSALVRIPG
ncbi:MAG: divergent polysaccharide deacetylase family protein [Desulfobacterales bacterium]|nr:divergent polysaccharide deacetylase family protein [Desulfobacterales bacterium]